MAGITAAGRIMLIIVSIPLGFMLILLLVLLALSPGRPRPFLDENGKALEGSISEKSHVPINGVQQGMFIVGKDIGNPVLLFLHGGTAMPEYFLAKKYPTGLEQYFTVCWWDRRPDLGHLHRLHADGADAPAGAVHVPGRPAPDCEP